MLKRVIVAAALFAAASLPASAQQLAPLRVTNFDNTIVLGLYRGIEKGYFKDAGIDLQIVKVATGAAAVSAVASGEADIGWAAATVPIFARSQGVPVKIFMTADQEGPPNHYGTFLDVSAKSGINSFADLKGKTIMINAFGTAGELALRDRLQKAGVSWDDVKKVTVPFPQMPAALELGNADLVVTIQPMHAAIMANKTTNAKVLDVGTLTDSKTKAVAASVYLATDAWLAKNQATALAFGRTFLKATKEVQADPKLRLEMVMKIAGMDEATAKTIPEAWFETIAVTKDGVGPAYDTLIRTGMMTKSFPVEDIIATLPY